MYKTIYPDDSTKYNGEWNEMTYYKDSIKHKDNKYGTKTYCNVWFDDNVGSFLIIIEKKKNKNK